MPYKRPSKEEDVREHGPNDSGQIRYVEQSGPIGFYEPRDDCIAKEVKEDKTEIVANDLIGGTRFYVVELFVLLKDHCCFEGGIKHSK